ncbi:LYG protein, partial [Edolisoma coerulescens]|nr:LYG protein [Edolisoma coerulescens]
EARGLDRAVCKSAFSSTTGYAMIRRTAEADLVRLRRYEIPIRRVARNLCLDPALIGAIMSQESRVGLLLDNGWDQGRQKYGLMQISRQQLQPFAVWDSEEHINQCSNILVLSINEVRARHPTWTWDRQLRGEISVYNAGVNTVQTYDKMDIGKTYNYANDVDA